MEKIKQLRDKTGAGIVDCKKALDESAGDIEKAVEILRKKGIAKAAKRGEREAGEGIIKAFVSEDKKEGFLVKFGAETDFVVRNEKFQDYAAKVMDIVKSQTPNTLDELNSKSYNEEMSVKDALDNMSGVIGEKLEISKFEHLKSSGTVCSYIHMEGKIGVLISLDSESSEELAYDLAMQIAAANPSYLSPEEVPAEEVEKEKAIYTEQLKKEGKDDSIIEKILVGKINKYYEEVCLLKQEFIKDDKQKVEQILGGAKIEKFIRFSF